MEVVLNVTIDGKTTRERIPQRCAVSRMKFLQQFASNVVVVVEPVPDQTIPAEDLAKMADAIRRERKWWHEREAVLITIQCLS